ncbi:MAG: CBS domain-containing protein [Thaumarchaeota archaeon]|nr:CBS domain-containing protein [Nitrososphaerota archaeon]
MNTKMDAVEVGGSVKEAVKKMVDAEIESVLVTKGGDPIGIITERDILQRVVYAGANTDKRVEEIMSHPLITVDPLATLGDAAQIMLQKKIRRLLVKEGEKIVGIITQRDLQRAFMETFNTLLLT